MRDAEIRQCLLVSTVAVIAFVLLGMSVSHGPGQSFDAWISAEVASWRSGLLTAVFSTLTFLGNTDTLIYASIVLLVIAGVYRPIRREAWWVVGLLLAVAVNSHYLKLFFARPRPDLSLALVHETSFSFPSGHSMMSICLFGFLGYLAATRVEGWKRAAVAGTAALLVVLMGFSRIYLGAHYACDVLAGFLAGLPLLMAAMLMHRRVAGAVKVTDPSRCSGRS